MARSRTTFRPGVSGNPSGRPRVLADVQAMAREHAPAAISALAEALRDPRTKVPAAIAILDRAYGRPVQAIAGDRELPLSIEFRWGDADPATATRATAEQAVRQAIVGATDEDEAPEGWDKGAGRLPN